MFKPHLLATSLAVALLGGCNADVNTSASAPQSVTEQSEITKANALFEDIFMSGVRRNPMYLTYLGMKEDYDKWPDISEANSQQELEIAKKDLARVQQLDATKLDAQTKISYTLMKQQLEQQIADFKWRFHSYPVNQMHGMHAELPAFMINQHSIANLEEANAYVARLNGMGPLLAQLIDGLKMREERGVMPPQFVYAHVIRDSKNILKGAPFDDTENSTLLADFSAKLDKITLEDGQKARLIEEAKAALLSQVKPGYSALIAYLEKAQKNADTRDGVWKLPDGEAFYKNALARTTTTQLDAEQIHTIGLTEVARIHKEMEAIKDKVGFKGNLQDFFAFMRTDKQFYFSNDEAGKQAYLTQATALIDNMKAQLDSLFIIKPKADLVVKQVEAFREKSAGKAFYQQPAPDGSRPGFYYANLYNMADMPNYQMEALAYHEGIPGHHMQIAIAQELEDMPKFRRFGGFTAYIEGWGLYSELLPKEIGLYEDPYSDFGRLAMELWRACRLVVDTGIHQLKWTREQAIDYLKQNTPNAEGDVVKAIERYIVMPSQATAYKIGMLKILELRKDAKSRLGDKFDIREFHDIVLKNGPVPLNVLESLVDTWVESKQSA